MIERVRATTETVPELLSPRYYQSRLLAYAALELGYKVEVYRGVNIVKFSHGGKSVFIADTRLPINSAAAAQMADDKFLTSTVLHNADVPVARSVKVTRAQFESGDWSRADVRFPVVVKPAVGSFRGIGVITNIKNQKELEKALRTSFKEHGSILIEEFYAGMQDYRVLVIDSRVVGVVLRVPAHVVGDGKHTVRELLKMKNETPYQGDKPKFEITVDAETRKLLREQRLTMDSIPKKKRHVQLKRVCNTGAGGEVHDVTDKICPENKRLAVKAAKAMEMRVAGHDFYCKDISKPLDKTGGVILEVNHCPGITLHHYPKTGKPQNVARMLVQAFFQ